MKMYKTIRYERDVMRWVDDGKVIQVPGRTQAYLEARVSGMTVSSEPVSEERAAELVEEWGGVPVCQIFRWPE